MPRVIAALIRHGDYHQLPGVPSAHQPFPLTELGEYQSREAADEVADILDANQWQLHPVVDSSNLLRAWQTAGIMVEHLLDHFPEPGELCSFDGLAERGLGSANNLTTELIQQTILKDPRFDPLPPDWKSNSQFRLPLQGAESLLEAGERVAAHLVTRMRVLKAGARGDTLKLFVGHGAAFRHAAFHLGILRFEEIARLSMYHASSVYLEYLGDREWQHIAGQWKVRSEQNEYSD
jgi:broad specificity phosphatase PhoE